MRFFDFMKPESRSAVYAQSDPRLLQVFGLSAISDAGEVVTIDSAMRVPAFFVGVNFLAGTLAGLPLHVYRKTPDGRKKVNNDLSRALHHAPNDEMSSFEWRKLLFTQVFTGGRGLTYIERDDTGKPVNFFYLDPSRVVVKRENGRKYYEYTGENGKKITYNSSEIVDVPFMLKSDGLGHYGPVDRGRDALGLALGITKYASRMFDNGGVPPFIIQGNFQTPHALQRASDDFRKAIRKAAEDRKQALVLPEGLEAKPLAIDPEKLQMVEVQKFCIQQIARAIGLPPVFLHDLSQGTYSNTEQQDLNFVKHTLKHWVELFEQELNLKLFGRNSNLYVEMNMDGILRGDFKTRIEAYARGAQVGLWTPNEIRERENLSNKGDAADQLYMQGAMVPIDMAGSGQAVIQEGEDGQSQ